MNFKILSIGIYFGFRIFCFEFTLMKILMLTPYLPYPLLSGGQIRTYNLLKHLSKKHSITLFSFIRDEKETQYIQALKEFCEDVQVFLKRPPWSFSSLAFAGMTFYPLVVCMYLKRSLRRAIAEAVARRRFDLIHAETFYVMPNIPDQTIPTILVEQTIEYLVYQHYTETVRSWPMKLVMNADVAKIKYWEKAFWKKATRVVAMSEADKNVMQKMVPQLDLSIVPNGVDTDFFPLRFPERRPKQPTVLFVGNFKWLQNKEAVSILVREIWPKILRSLPKAKLWIVGRYPSEEIQQFASDTVSISTFVEDIREAYAKASVLLAPIYGPGGTRYKILESMATGVPVITTTTGIEGIGARNGEDALIADHPEQLAKKTIDVLTHPELYGHLVKNGRTLVHTRFRWQTIAQSLDRIYEKAAHG